MKKIKVLIVDDSIVTQNVMQVIFQQDPEIQVVGVASNPEIANKLLEKTHPDVMTLDVDMPQMDGITYLKQLMQTHPMPVVMVSAFTEPGGAITLEALSLGAVDYVEKLKANDSGGFQHYAKRLITTVKKAAQANIQPLITPAKKADIEKLSQQTFNPDFLRSQLIVVGSSTGGVEAVEKLLGSFPEHIPLPPIMLVQHIQREFVGAFVRRLNKLCNATAYEATQDMEIEIDRILVGGRGLHLAVVRRNKKYFCDLQNGLLVHGQRPSVEVLFESAADVFGKNVIGILLTGMGKDGANGLKAIQLAGGETIAQDEETSVVWGMPGEAVKLGAANHVLPLQDISAKVLSILNKRAEVFKKE